MAIVVRDLRTGSGAPATLSDSGVFQHADVGVELGRYFAPLGPDALDAVGRLVFGGNSGQWADPWMKGDISCRDIAVYLSKQLPESEERILAALRAGCSNMRFNAAVYGFALLQREAGRKTALVTANMDVFTEIVVPAHGLDAIFDIVLNTADHGTLDKSLLWRKALVAFGSEHSFSSTLLIDDSPRMIALFNSLGGLACQYQGEHAFQGWMEANGWQTEMQIGIGHPIAEVPSLVTVRTDRVFGDSAVTDGDSSNPGEAGSGGGGVRSGY